MPQLDTDLSAVGAGLDALDAPSEERRPSLRKRFVRTAVPPLLRRRVERVQPGADRREVRVKLRHDR